MAREKARIMRRKKKSFALLGQAVLAGKESEKRRKAEQEKRVQREQKASTTPAQKISAQAKILHNKTDDALKWQRYKVAGRGKGNENEEVK